MDPAPHGRAVRLGRRRGAAAFNRDLHDSEELSRADLDRQGLLRRFGQASARLMSPLL